MGEGAFYIEHVVMREVAAFDALYDAASKDFRNLEAKANELAEQEYQRLGGELVGEDWNGDMADIAEKAEAAGLTFYERTFPLAQTLSNLSLAMKCFSHRTRARCLLATSGSKRSRVPLPKPKSSFFS
jgi:hypothetical protein